MSAPAIPTNIILQTANQQVLVSWPIVSGATSYLVQRSFDGVNWGSATTISGNPLNNFYLDTTVTVGTTYYYQVASSNGTASSYAPSSPVSIVPCLPGQINLGMLRYQSQLRAEMLNSQFLTLDEWNININKSMFELFDILSEKFGENYAVASPWTFTTTGAKNYALPDGSSNFSGSPPAVKRILGLDCGVAVGNNAWVTLPRYNWIDRNRFVYPQLQANALGVFNLSYRQMGNQVYFIPNPTAGQYIQIWYEPIMTMLLQDTDMLSFSISGWDEYVVIDAAIKALTKEESFEQAAALKNDKAAMLERIETSAANRDAGIPNTISDTRTNTGFFDGGGFGGTGHGMGGWAVALFPGFASNHVRNGLLIHSIFSSKGSLAYSACAISAAYLLYLLYRKNGSGIRFSGARYSLALRISSLFHHIGMIFRDRSEKKMIRTNASRIITMMAACKCGINLAVSKLIGKTMRAGRLSNSDGTALEIPANSSVSLPVQISGPNPTPARLTNMAPKSLFQALFHRFYLSRGGEK